MVERVATGFQNQTSLRQLRQTQVDINKSTFQITTGQVSNRLRDLSASSNELLNLGDLKKNTDMYLSNITTAENRLKSTESSLQGMNDLLSEARQLSTLARNENTAETRASLAPKAQSLAETFYSILKTKFDGRFIFSGQNGGEPPTNDVATATAFPGSPVPTTYYIGDSVKPAIISGPGITTEYGITGDEAGIAEIKASLEALWFGLENNSLGDIDNAISTLDSAQDDIASLLGTVGGQLNSMEQLTERHTNTGQFLQEQIDEIDKVDISEAITRFSQQQATLEASMMIITQVNRLSLLDFLN
jgi:flagellar hook-associated protein 3 FlgL